MSTPVEQIKERLHIEDVVGSYVKLERAGKSLKAKCPFHNEKTASFYVSPDRGGYYCFGCGAKGDIFSFVEQFEGLDFMGALKLLAERAGIDISRGQSGLYGTDYAKTKSEKDRLYMAMEIAAAFFETALRADSPAAAEARDYVKKRGITEATAKEFRIGFAPAEWRLLYHHLRAKSFTDAEIEKAGLAKRPDAGEGAGGQAPGSSVVASSASVKTPYDRFRDRIMFPIFDSSGRVIAFSGRILHDTAPDGKAMQAKYLNSPDTPLYNKSSVLYGIDKAKQAIRERGYTILVEGQMDLVLSHQAGIKNTVAVSGTALTESVMTESTAVNNLGIVRRLSPNIILAFDSDAAGRKAAMRSAEIALSLGMDVKIADMPEGRDPADLVLADPESWKNVLRAAKPVVEFQLDRVLAEVSEKRLDPRKIPALLRERVYPFIAMLASRTDQAHYVKMVRERALANAENEAVIWEDIQKITQAAQIAQKKSASMSTGQDGAARATMLEHIGRSHLDVIARELFGLLAYLARERILDVRSCQASVRNIAGDSRYHNLIHDAETSNDELAFAAELFFGNPDELRAHPETIQRKLDEIVLNFEEEIVRSDLALAMGKLAQHADDAVLNADIQALVVKRKDIDDRRRHFF